MRWFTKHLRNVGIVSVGVLLLLMGLALIPLSAASAHEGTPSVATPTVDATVTALNKDLLTLQVKQLQNQIQNQNNWLANNSTAIIAAFASVIVALFGIYQWAGNRKDERQKARDAQDKDLKAQAEERFKTAVTALGGEKEGVQVGGAILLRSFLNKDNEDDERYKRYYTQIFDLAVAYLRLPRTPLLPEEDPDSLHAPPSPSDLNTPLPLTTLSQALITIFKETFSLARDRLKEGNSQFSSQFLDASRVQLDNAYLGGADLGQVWMQQASLQKADLTKADLHEANLHEASLRYANLSHANLSGINLSYADLNSADFSYANLSNANLSNANLSNADLSGVDLSTTNLTEVNLNEARLRGAHLSEVNLGASIILRHFGNHSGINLVKADLSGAHLSGANLRRDDLSYAHLTSADLRGATLWEANLSHAWLYNAHLEGAHLESAHLESAHLEGAYLAGAHLEGAYLAGAHLEGVKGMTKEQLATCKARGAIIDEDLTTSSSQSAAAPSSSPQSNDTQTPSAPSAQGSTPPPDPDRSNTASSQQESES